MRLWQRSIQWQLILSMGAALLASILIVVGIYSAVVNRLTDRYLVGKRCPRARWRSAMTSSGYWPSRSPPPRASPGTAWFTTGWAPARTRPGNRTSSATCPACKRSRRR